MVDVHKSFSEHGICAVCRKRPVERWCDYIINYDNSIVFTRDYKSFIEINSSTQYDTCDLPMCVECATKVSTDRDLCPHHMSLQRKVELLDQYQRRRQAQEKANRCERKDRRMKTGTKSLLFGVHHFAWHPFTVWLAWYKLYGRPTWKETVCIIIHDWGYWFCPNMDGPEGQEHPEFGANIAAKWFGDEYGRLVLYHSRHYAQLVGAEPSKLCWADKLSILYDPKWFYLIRAISSGEIKEYRQNAEKWIPLSASHSKWYDWLKPKFIKLVAERRGDVVPYMSSKR